MTSALRELADDYAALLDAGALSGLAEAEVTYLPRIDLVDSDDLQAYVIPGSRTKVRTSLGGVGACSAETEFKLQVVLYQHHKEGDAADIDEADSIAELAEDIQDAAIGLNIGDYWCTGCEMTSGDGRVLDIDEIEQRNAYCAVLELLFRGIA
jgi:hypothetical protein